MREGEGWRGSRKFRRYHRRGHRSKHQKTRPLTSISSRFLHMICLLALFTRMSSLPNLLMCFSMALWAFDVSSRLSGSWRHCRPDFSMEALVLSALPHVSGRNGVESVLSWGRGVWTSRVGRRREGEGEGGVGTGRKLLATTSHERMASTAGVTALSDWDALGRTRR